MEMVRQPEREVRPLFLNSDAKAILLNCQRPKAVFYGFHEQDF